MARPKKRTTKNTNGLGTVWQLQNGRWRWQVTLGYDSSGKRIARSGTEATKTAAEISKAEAIAEHQRGTLAAPDKMTLGEWLDDWLKARAQRVSENTVVSYSSIIRNHIKPLLGAKRLQLLKPTDLRGFYQSLSQKGKTPKTIRNIHGVLYAALSDAVRLEIITRNICEVIRPEVSSQDNNKMASQAWTASEAVRFLSVARGDRLYTVFYLLLSLGLRRGEVLGLRWQNVNLERSVLQIEQALVAIRGIAKTQKPKTKNSRRSLRLPLEVIDALRLHRAMQDQMHKEEGITPVQDWVFTTRNGTPIHPDNLNRTLERLCTLAGVKQVRVHDLRHTYASLARRAGVPLEVVSEKLGHARASFTADVYRHTFEDEHDIGALNLSQLLADRPRATN
jgi:integrase